MCITLEPRGNYKTDPFVIQDHWKERMPCGHPRSCLIQADEGTAHCGWCEEVARLRQALAKRKHEHRADVVSVLYARNEAAEQVYEWYGECCKEVEKLRKEEGNGNHGLWPST